MLCPSSSVHVVARRCADASSVRSARVTWRGRKDKDSAKHATPADGISSRRLPFGHGSVRYSREVGKLGGRIHRFAKGAEGVRRVSAIPTWLCAPDRHFFAPLKYRRSGGGSPVLG